MPLTSADTTRLLFIPITKHLSCTLTDIDKITRHANRGHSPCDGVRKLIQHRIDEKRFKMNKMMKS